MIVNHGENLSKFINSQALLIESIYFLDHLDLIKKLFHNRIGDMERPVPDEVILGLLKAQPSHGYELLEWFKSDSQLGRIWTMSTSQLYAVLKRLERDEAIEGDEVVVQNAPPKTVYKLKPGGDARLEAWLTDPQPSASIHRIRVLFLSRIFIANLLCRPHGEIVKAQINACQAQKEVFQNKNAKRGSDIEKLTIDFVISQLNSAISWLKESDFNLFISKRELKRKDD